MKTYGEKFFVKYDLGSVRNHDLGSGIIIEIAAECNTDIRGNSDQIATIECVPEGHNFFKKGDKVLTHYLSSSPSNAIDVNGDTLHRISLREIFARINEDDTFELAEDTYFCEDIIKDVKSESGIYTSFDSEVKESLKLKVTHIPSSINKDCMDDKIKVGDLIMPQDDFNYIFTYNRKKHIKIEHKFIAAVFVNA